MKRVAAIASFFLMIDVLPIAAYQELPAAGDSLSLRLISPRPGSGAYSLPVPGERRMTGITGNLNYNGYHSGNFVNAGEEQFYANLSKIAQRWRLTNWLQSIVIKSTASAGAPEEEPRQGVKDFIPWEGKIIRDIHYTQGGLFAGGFDSQGHSSGGMGQVAGFFHFNTNPRVIRNNMLVTPGDRIDPFILAENERILRKLPYLEDAQIFVFENKLDPEYADLVVVTKDRWSRGFDVDMSDIDKGHIDIYDRNILGRGQEMQGRILLDGSEDKHIGFGTTVSIQNAGGSFINTRLNYTDAFDNRSFHIKTGRNFITPSMKYAGGAEFLSASLLDDFQFPDTIFLNQSLNFHEYDYWLGRSFLLDSRGRPTRRNIYITTRFNRHLFFDRPQVHGRARHSYHNRNLYLASLILTRSAYLKSNYIYEFGPTEDIPVGSVLEVTGGYEDNQFYQRFYAGFAISHSNFIEGTGYLSTSVSAGTFFNNNVREQGVIRLNSSGFSGILHMNRFLLRQFLSIDYTLGIRRFDDEAISISNRRGIRGMRSDELSGTSRFTIQSETMFYARKSWYGFRYAIYGMADLGWIGNGEKLFLPDDFYSGFGIGLRVRNEHLVLPTLQFRIAYFPRIPEHARTRLFYIISEKSGLFDRFTVSAPDILPYR